MRKWHIVRFWTTIIASIESFCVKRSHFFGFTVGFRCYTPHTDKQLKEIWEFGHPCVRSMSGNELMVHKQPPCAKIEGKSVQNRGQSVILSGENHHLPYTIIGGGESVRIPACPIHVHVINYNQPDLIKTSTASVNLKESNLLYSTSSLSSSFRNPMR